MRITVTKNRFTWEVNGEKRIDQAVTTPHRISKSAPLYLNGNPNYYGPRCSLRNMVLRYHGERAGSGTDVSEVIRRNYAFAVWLQGGVARPAVAHDSRMTWLDGAGDHLDGSGIPYAASDELAVVVGPTGKGELHNGRTVAVTPAGCRCPWRPTTSWGTPTRCTSSPGCAPRRRVQAKLKSRLRPCAPARRTAPR